MGKKTFIITPDLFINSEDLFRTAFGGYYSSEDDDTGTNINFLETNLEEPLDKKFDTVYYEQEHTIAEYTNIVPNYTVPVRASSDNPDLNSDKEWATYMLGGQFGDMLYEQKISNTEHEYVNLFYDLPYSKIEKLELADQSIADTVEITYEYRQYLPIYQEALSIFETELYIPNFYMLSDIYRYSNTNEQDVKKIYSSDLLNFLSLENQYNSPQTIFDFNSQKIPYAVPPHIADNLTDIRKTNTDLSIKYLNSTNFIQPSGSELVDWASTKQKALLFDSEAIKNIKEQENLQECLPFYVKLQLTTKKSGEFIESYIDNGFDSKLLEVLNSTFASDAGLTPELKNYNNSMESFSVVDGQATQRNSLSLKSYREINYIDFLTFCRDIYRSSNSDCMFVGENNLKRLSAIDQKGTYRHVNISNSTRVLLHAVNFLKNSSKIKIDNWDSFYGNKQGYNETIAYRVEKIGGPPANDSLTQNVLQNYWFLNSSELEEFMFFDNQVFFNKDYTYNIYTYVICSGIKYKYEDLRLTVELGCEEENKHGLEFYDPTNNNYNNRPRLFSGSADNGFDDNAGGTYGSQAQIFSKHKYLADFNIKYEHELKIIEIPVYSKTLRILDNPPNKLSITPYQVLDDSQTICFDLNNGVFNRLKYPLVITDTDEDYRASYLNSNDLLSDSKLLKKTISKIQRIEVFRLSERPSSIKDFENNLFATIDLTIENQREVTKEFVKYSDRVRTNQKYYYVFRAVNQNDIPGQLSEIYEAELINDGGYKFALFNTISESELQGTTMQTYSTEMKKIFQLSPNLSQVSFDTTDVDFSNNAKDEIGNLKIGSADDLIWDKTYKLRLTSKKTGKKIDLNITYKIGSE